MAFRESVLTYVELVAAANSGDGEARVELTMVERRMLDPGDAVVTHQGATPRDEQPSPGSGRPPSDI